MFDRRLFGGLITPTALGALALAGCGSTDNSDTAFINKVNIQCQKAQTAIQGLGQPAGSTMADDAAFLQRSLPVIQSQDQAVKAITPPGNLRSDYAKGLALQDEEVAEIKLAIAAGETGDTKAFNQALAQQQTLSAQGDAIATRIGITDCVNKSATATTSSSATTTT